MCNRLYSSLTVIITEDSSEKPWFEIFDWIILRNKKSRISVHKTSQILWKDKENYAGQLFLESLDKLTLSSMKKKLTCSRFT